MAINPYMMKRPAQAAPVHFAAEDPEQPGVTLEMDLVPLNTALEYKAASQYDEKSFEYMEKDPPSTMPAASDGTQVEPSERLFRDVCNIEQMQAGSEKLDFHALCMLSVMMPVAWRKLVWKCGEINNAAVEAREKKATPPASTPNSLNSAAESSGSTPNISIEPTNSSGVSTTS